MSCPLNEEFAFTQINKKYLKGAVLINNGQGYGPNHWAGKVEISKPVSRPWVEWMKDELIDTEVTEAKAATEAMALPLPPMHTGSGLES